jgi:CBS domain containing-hemolysin-like protein
MTPRTDIVAIEADSSPEEARRLIADSGHSRIPVTDGHIDRIVGILYAKDLLQQFGREGAGDLRVRQVMREPLFVPETKKLDELQAELQAHKVHIAIVLDEYGGTAGLVTIEDIIEEVFGEIVDEYEREPPQPIRRAEDGAYVVEARVHINELNHELGLDLPEDEDYETIGGFVLSRLGTIPKEGDVFSEDGLRITVLEAEERRVMRLRIDLAPENPPEEP